ncbi:TPA: hypothetical protein ACN983_001109 [Vibrio parahaemolyticus]
MLNINEIAGLLYDEKPLVVRPKLAAAIGLNEAIVLQQIRYRSNGTIEHYGTERLYEGKYWFFKTMDDWLKEFPFFARNTVRRAIDNLKDLGLIDCRKLHGHFFKNPSNQTVWYALGDVFYPESQNGTIENNNPTNGNCKGVQKSLPKEKLSTGGGTKIPTPNAEGDKNPPVHAQIGTVQNPKMGLSTESQNGQLSTENTTEITTKNTDQKIQGIEKQVFDTSNLDDKVLSTWKNIQNYVENEYSTRLHTPSQKDIDSIEWAMSEPYTLDVWDEGVFESFCCVVENELGKAEKVLNPLQRAMEATNKANMPEFRWCELLDAYEDEISELLTGTKMEANQHG